MSTKSKQAARQRRRKRSRKLARGHGQELAERAKRAGLLSKNARIVSNLDGISTSDALVEFAEPLLSDGMSFESYEGAIRLACHAWNLAEASAPLQREMLQESRSLFRNMQDIMPDPERKGELLLRALIERKQREFSHIHRFILDVEVSDRPDKYDVVVLSIPIGPPKRAGR